MRSRVNLVEISVRSSSPRSKVHVEVERLDAHGVGATGAQAHFDPLVLRVEERDVVEALGVEVCVEFAVDHASTRCG